MDLVQVNTWIIIALNFLHWDYKNTSWDWIAFFYALNNLHLNTIMIYSLNNLQCDPSDLCSRERLGGAVDSGMLYSKRDAT